MKKAALLLFGGIFASSHTSANYLLTPQISGSLDLWESKGGLIWAHDASSACDCLGSKTSELDWKNVEVTGVMLNLNAEFKFPVFVNLRIAGGSAESGKIIDDDYFSKEFADSIGSPERFSRTSSEIRDGKTSFSELQLGYKHKFQHLNLDYISIFLSKSIWKEEYGAYGVNYIENPLGGQLGEAVPYSVRVLSHEADVDSINLGIGAKFDLTPKLSLETEYQRMANAKISSKDTHHLRPDDFIKPSELHSKGNGFMAQAKLHYQINDKFGASVGYRAMSLSTNGGSIKLHNPEESRSFPLIHQNVERSGFTAGMTYIF